MAHNGSFVVSRSTLLDSCVNRLRRARTDRDCKAVVAGYLAHIIGPKWLLYFGVLTLSDQLKSHLARREGDDRRWQPSEEDVDEMCRRLAESPKADAILHNPVPTVQVKEDRRVGVGTVRFFQIGGHAVVIVVTSAEMPHPLPDDFALVLREFAVRLRQLEVEEMAVGANRDELTALLTKAAYQAETRRRLLLACTRRSAASVAIMDLDNFKMMNTELRYLDADRVIASVGSLISASVRGNDRVAVGRFGGDEFMFTFDADAYTAANVMQGILNRLADIVPVFTDEHAAAKFRDFGGCKASVGIATCRFDALQDGNYDSEVAKAVENVTKNANDALTKAKERKNCIEVYREVLVTAC